MDIIISIIAIILALICVVLYYAAIGFAICAASYLAYYIFIGVIQLAYYMFLGVITLAYYIFMGAIETIYYILDAIIIHPIENLFDNDLYFLYEKNYLSLYEWIFLPRDKKNTFKSTLKQNDFMIGLIKSKKISKMAFEFWGVVGSVPASTEFKTGYKNNNLERSLNDINVLELFQNNIIKFSEINNLNEKKLSNTLKLFNSSVIVKLFKEKKVTLKQLEDLPPKAHKAIENKTISDLIDKDILKINQLMSITNHVINLLSFSYIAEAFKKSFFTFDYLENMSKSTMELLSLDGTLDLLSNGAITFNQLEKMNKFSLKILTKNVLELLSEQFVTINDINEMALKLQREESIHNYFERKYNHQTLSYEKILREENIFNNNNIKYLFKRGIISFKKIMHLDFSILSKALQNDKIMRLIEWKKISVEQIDKFNLNAIDLLNDGKITVKMLYKVDEDLKNLRKSFLKAIERFNDDGLYQLCKDDKLTFEDILYFTDNMFRVLKQDFILSLFKEKKLTFFEIENLGRYPLEDLQPLKERSVYKLFLKNYLSINDVVACSRQPLFIKILNIESVQYAFRYQGLKFKSIASINFIDLSLMTRARNNIIIERLHDLDRIRSGPLGMTISLDITANIINIIENFNMETNTLLATKAFENDTESTHTNSSELTFSKFVINIKNKYPMTLPLPDGDIIKIRYFLEQHKNSSKDWQKDLNLLNYIFYNSSINSWLEPKSKCTIGQLLILTYYVALEKENDNEYMTNYAQALFSAIYEMRRGKNMDHQGVDDGAEEDKHICITGFFNKILEKMVGILPGCQFIQITTDTILCKMKAILKQKIKAFITIEKASALTKTFEAVSHVFNALKTDVSKEMYEEFGDEAKVGLNIYDIYKESNEELAELIQNTIEETLKSTITTILKDKITVYINSDRAPPLYCLNDPVSNVLNTLKKEVLDEICQKYDYSQYHVNNSYEKLQATSEDLKTFISNRISEHLPSVSHASMLQAQHSDSIKDKSKSNIHRSAG